MGTWTWHYKDLLGSIVKEGYGILVQDLYLVGMACNADKTPGLMD